MIFVTRADVDVRVRYVAFQNLGRTTIEPPDNTTFDGNGNVTHIGTNQIGRYVMHFHHVMGPGRRHTCCRNRAADWWPARLPA